MEAAYRSASGFEDIQTRDLGRAPRQAICERPNHVNFRPHPRSIFARRDMQTDNGQLRPIIRIDAARESP